MSKAVEITFHGMAGLVSSASCVVMPNRKLEGGAPLHDHGGHGHGAHGTAGEHRTRLAIPTDCLEDWDETAKSWAPSEVIVFGKLELAIWNLDGLDVRIETSETAAPTKPIREGGPPSQGNGMIQRSEMLSLRKEHPEAKTRRDWETVAGCARVWLNGGMIGGAGNAKFKDAGSFTGRDIASHFSWKSNQVDKFAITNGIDRIVLSLRKDAKLSITNSAVAPGKHFGMMYSLISGLASQPIDPADDAVSTEVYPAETCKPPVEMPEP